MKRREFLRRTLPATALPITLNGFPIRALGASGPGGAASAAMDRVVVLVFLSGGNDGINTVIPLDQYSTYQSLRPLIAIPEPRVLPLTEATGLHPSATGLRSLYSAGKVAVVQGVAYPNPNLSHFRATDIWVTASGYNQVLDTGWAGRYLETEFPEYPEGYPNGTMPDPPAIQIGAIVSPAFQGSSQTMGSAIQDPATFYQLVSGSSASGPDTAPDTTPGHELSYIRTVENQSRSYAVVVKAAADRAQNKSALYPAASQRNSLSEQLKIVARLVGGGLRTPFYMVSLGGFDTHSNQVDSADHSTGTHATLIERLSTALLAFQDDLELLGASQRVVTVVFSEFGRRVGGNTSQGTDHGTAQPVFLVGQHVRGGVVGRNPSLTDLSSGNLKVQYDYRSVYASLLTQWLGETQAESDGVLLQSFAPLDLIRNPALLPRRRPVREVAD
jgi:uncharacterized protein (DUF1501 family)